MSRRQSPGGGGTALLYERSQRELQKGNIKEALKGAKLCWRENPSPEHRALLEQAYFNRVEQLQRMKLPVEARSVLDELTQFGPTLPDVVEGLRRLRLELAGPAEVVPAEIASDPAQLAQFSDLCVANPDLKVRGMEELRAHADLVRGALAKVEQGEDDAAAELLRNIPRTSPLADWRLFVRGLSAFYAGDQDRTAANWQRLDSSRAPHRIAEALQIAAGDLPEAEASPLAKQRAAKVRQHVESGMLNVMLKRLRQEWDHQYWSDFFETLNKFAAWARDRQPAALDAVLDLAWKTVCREGDEDLLNLLCGAAKGPTLDPKWYRAKATFFEHPRAGDFAMASDYWSQYAQLVANLPVLAKSERPIAAALVWQRIARLAVQSAEKALDFDFVFDSGRSRGERKAERLRKEAAKAYQRSIETFPGLVSAYRELVKLYEETEKLSQAAQVAEDLVSHFPDDFDARLWLASYYLNEYSPKRAQEHLEHAARLKPRDPKLSELRWTQRVTSILQLGRDPKNIGRTRAAWDEIQRDRLPRVPEYELDVLRAALEFRTGEEVVGKSYVDAALGKVCEPAVIWLLMSYFACRLSLPRQFKKQYDELFKKAVTLPTSSQTAGELARVLWELRNARITYPGMATHQRLVVSYIKRGERLAWQEAELRNACRFLMTQRGTQRFVEQLLDCGLVQFPQNPLFHYWIGQRQVELGPFRCNRDLAADCLRKALELASNDPAFTSDLSENANHMLLLVESVLDPFEAWEDDEDEDEDWDWEFFDEEDSGPSPTFAPGGVDHLEALKKLLPPRLMMVLQKIIERGGNREQAARQLFIELTGQGDSEGKGGSASRPK